LDIKATHQYLQMMLGLIASGRKIILVTHHLHEILFEIEWFVFLKKGQLVAEGEGSKLLTDKSVSDMFEMPIRIEEIDGRLVTKAASV